MEESYTVDGYPHVSHLVDVSEYFSDFFSCISETVYTLIEDGGDEQTEGDKIEKAMGITSTELEQLSSSLNLSLLDLENEETKSPIKKGRAKKKNPEDLLLEKATRTLATAVELKVAKSHRIRYSNKLKNMKSLPIADFKREEADAQVNQMSGSVVLVARVYKPFHSHTTIPNFVAYPRTVSHELDIMLHGSQTLDKFRDRIMCINDEVVVGAPSRDEGSQVPMKELFTSGMFFFGDTFYCDFRDTMNKDYGRVIDEWSKARPEMRLGPFKHASMEHTVISDLKIRLGFPYVYVHLGVCEHLITFLDARLMSPTDIQDVDRYPLVVPNAETKIIYCNVCDIYPRAWVVDDDQFPTKPTYLCKQCLDVFYTRNGQRTDPPYCCMLPGTTDNSHDDS